MKSKKIFFLVSAFLIFIIGCQSDNDSFKEALEQDKNFNSAEELYPDIEGEKFYINKRNKISVIRKNNKNILSGDIILTKNQLDLLSNNSDLGRRTGLISRRWDNYVVYYKINKNLPNKDRVLNAFNHWKEKFPDISFVERSVQNNYIEFIGGSGCGSNLGMTGGRQVIILGSGCSLGNTIHEIGHALGFLHEHQRSDRNSYVKINYSNILPNKKGNFRPHDSIPNISGYEIGRFDFNSIMLYGSYFFSKDKSRLPTITKLNGSTFVAQRTSLSVGDVEMIKNMYNNPPRMPDVKNFVVTSNPNIPYSFWYSNRFYFKFDIKGNYGYSQINLWVYEGKKGYKPWNSDDLCALIKWNREGDDNINYQSYYTKSMWSSWFGKDYTSPPYIKNKTFTLVVEFEGKYKFLYYTV